MMKAIQSEGLMSVAHLTGATANVDFKFSWRTAEEANDVPDAYLKAIISLSSLISRYSYEESGYRLCIVDDYMNLDYYFFNHILIILEIFVHQVTLLGKGEVFWFF